MAILMRRKSILELWWTGFNWATSANLKGFCDTERSGPTAMWELLGFSTASALVGNVNINSQRRF